MENILRRKSSNGSSRRNLNMSISLGKPINNNGPNSSNGNHNNSNGGGNPEEDPQDPQREYNECVLEIKHELACGHNKQHNKMGSLALHQEAMKRLNEKQMARQRQQKLEQQQRLEQEQLYRKQNQKPGRMKRQSSMDAVARLFSIKLADADDDDSLGGILDDHDGGNNRGGGFSNLRGSGNSGNQGRKNSTILMGGDQSISSLMFGDEIDVPVPLKNGSGGGGGGGGLRGSDISRRRSSAMSSTRVSLNSISMMFREVSGGGSSNSNAESERQKVLRRRSSVMSSLDHDEDYISNDYAAYHRRDLELSESEDDENSDEEEEDAKPVTFRPGGGRRNSLLRSSFTRRRSRRGSGLLRSSITKAHRTARRGSNVSNRSSGSEEGFNSSDLSLDSNLRGEFSGAARVSCGGGGGSGGTSDSGESGSGSGSGGKAGPNKEAGLKASFDDSYEEKKFETMPPSGGVGTRGRPGLSRRMSSRRNTLRSSLASVDEDADLPAGNAAATEDALEKARRGSLICGWGRNSLVSMGSFNEKDLALQDETTEGGGEGDGDDLLCGWGDDSQVSSVNEDDPWRQFDDDNDDGNYHGRNARNTNHDDMLEKIVSQVPTKEPEVKRGFMGFDFDFSSELRKGKKC